MDVVQQKLGRIRFDHTLWMNELLFALKEIELFRNRIKQLQEQYTDTANTVALENLLGEFNGLVQSAHEIQGNVGEHLKSMHAKIQANGQLESLIDGIHDRTEGQMKVFRDRFETLKNRFNQFNAKRIK